METGTDNRRGNDRYRQSIHIDRDGDIYRELKTADTDIDRYRGGDRDKDRERYRQ